MMGVCPGVTFMSLFLLITIVALLAVFSVDVRQKRREYLKQEKSTK
jgi:hypothetical protein